MQKGKFTRIFESRDYAEALARKFYLKLGHKAPDNCSPDYMRDSNHPMERVCYEMALEAIDTFMRKE